MNRQRGVVIDVIGEGKTDVGQDKAPTRPTNGVVPILLNKLCGKPEGMLIRRFAFPFAFGKGLRKKAWLAKRRAHYHGSAGVVFVLDSEGCLKDLKSKRTDLQEGRDQGLPEFPMAVGVAHPCIEAWLLADAEAIRRACELNAAPTVPLEPEQLPAPRHDRQNNPKTALARAAGSKHGLSAEQKDRIAAEMNDLDLVRQRCRLGFAPFAEEVEQRIRPLF